MTELESKLQQIFDIVSRKDKQRLKTELSKMIPVGDKSKISVKIGWGHYPKKVQTGITITLTNFTHNNDKNVELLLSDLLLFSDLEEKKIIEGFDVILTEKPTKVNIGIIPALEIAENVIACSINFKIQLAETIAA